MTQIRILPFIFLALVLALLTRLPYFGFTDFPLNDGALFYVMSKTIIESGLTLPDFITFNERQIPFAYPPLALWIAAAVSKGFGISLLGVYTWLPLLVSLVTLVPLVFIFRFFCTTRAQLFFAIVCLCVVGRSFEWIVMGGGMTRSFGQLFFLTTVALLISSRRSAVLLCAGVSAGLAACSHLEWGLDAVGSCLLFLLCTGGAPLARMKSVLVVGAAGAVVVVPWLLHVFETHGLAPYLAARATSGSSPLLALMTFLRTAAVGVESGYAPLICWAALWGMFSRLGRGEFLLFAWHFLLFVLTPRHGLTVAAITVPLFAGPAFARLFEVLPAKISGLIQAIDAKLQRTENTSTQARGTTRGTQPGYIILGALAVWYFTIAWSGQLQHSPAVPLGLAERELMQRARELVPGDGSVVVVGPSQTWDVDRHSEWFTVLAERSSILTVQGTEWLPAEGFALLENAAARIKWLTNMRMPIVDAFVSDFVVKPHYLVVFNAPDNQITKLFEGSLHYRPLLVSRVGGIYIERQQPGSSERSTEAGPGADREG